MKKTFQILAIVFGLTAFGLAPVVVQAQANDIIEVEDGTIPSAGAPDTGIAPKENKVLQNAAVFVGGSLLGAGIGLTFLTMRKKRFDT